MGGGPRTFPGGVSKWQWIRMLAKKKRERDKIWLTKERSLYERRRRAQIMALMPVRPWEKVPPSAPSLPAVDHDPKIQEMARRFQRDRGLDLWRKEDGPEKCNQVPMVDQAGKGSIRPLGVHGFQSMPLTVSQRVVEMNKQELGGVKPEATNRFTRPSTFSSRLSSKFTRQEQQPVEHSGSLLASYLRGQGQVMGLELPDEAKQSCSSQNDGAPPQRTDYSAWMEALASDDKSSWRQKRRADDGGTDSGAGRSSW